MNIFLFKYAVSTLSFTFLTISINGLSARAETEDFAANSSEVIASLAGVNTLVAPTDSSNTTVTLKAEPHSAVTAFDTPSLVAQADEGGRANRFRFSIGVGGDIGFTGGPAMGQGSFSVSSRIGLSDNFSLRPSVGFTDDVNFLIPLTVDFPTGTISDNGFGFVPYLGGGVVITTGDDEQVEPMATAGVDVPLIDQLGANAQVNVGFLDDTEVGVNLGLSYSF